MNSELTAALSRLEAALERLETGVTRHFDTDLRRSDLEVELQVMSEDRVRLAGELDSASARVTQLEAAVDHVGDRMGLAIGTIEDILARERAFGARG